MKWIHIITSLIVLLLLVVLADWVNPSRQPQTEYVAFETFEKQNRLYTRIGIATAVLFVGGQLAFVINLVGGLTNKLLTKK